MSEEKPPIELATFFHYYGFHREKGQFPGVKLREKLKPLVDEAIKANTPIRINLNSMHALYGSFIDGAFGMYMDELKESFFEKFIFISETNPSLLGAVHRVFKRHQERNFNKDVAS